MNSRVIFTTIVLTLSVYALQIPGAIGETLSQKTSPDASAENPSKVETTPVTVTREVGNVKAELSVDVIQESDRLPQYKNTRIKMTRDGNVVFDQAIVDNATTQELADHWVPAARENREENAQEMILRDLDGDREPELIVSFYSGGAHCCSTSAIYGYNAKANTYNPVTHYWGNGSAPTDLKDLNRDGKLEFVSHDDAFAYAFGSYAGSGAPLQIWNYRKGTMVNVTRQHRTLVYNDAYRWWQAFQAGKKAKDNTEFGRGLLAAYVADKYVLGEGKEGWERAQKAYYGDDKKEFFSNLRKFLQETGYAKGTVKYFVSKVEK
jgi:hypothetical protein